ncbi:MAG: hypothetical protein NTX59_08380 [Elusimicrobia bacterium]|nr:hypothetical protein [Elusimicrobiota bacterium]
MAYKKLSEDELRELRDHWNALPEEEKNTAQIASLAERFGVSKNTIIRKVKSDTGGKRKTPGAKRAYTKKTKNIPAAPGAGMFQSAVCGIVDAKFAAFREELPALIEAALAKLIKG